MTKQMLLLGADSPPLIFTIFFFFVFFFCLFLFLAREVLFLACRCYFIILSRLVLNPKPPPAAPLCSPLRSTVSEGVIMKGPWLTRSRKLC